MHEFGTIPPTETNFSPEITETEQTDTGTQELDAEVLRDFEDNFNEHYEGIVSFLRRKCGQDAEDIAQQTFTKALEKWNNFTDQGKGRGPWLQTIARNLFLDKVRREQRILMEPIDTNNTIDNHLPPTRIKGPEQAAIEADERQRIHSLLSALPDDFGDTLRSMVLSANGQTEVAEDLGIAGGTAGSRVNRARTKAAHRLLYGDNHGVTRPTQTDLKGRKRGSQYLDPSETDQ
jgi:RNA polymerase sigma-70 factor (ECF subfamily)